MSIVTLTDEAIEHFSKAAKDKNLKFGIIGGGCSGFQYHWATFDDVEPHMEQDEVTDYGTFKLYVDSYSLEYLVGTVVDYVSDLAGSRVEIMNPNVTGGCGCGESINF